VKTVLVALNPHAGATSAGDRVAELGRCLSQAGLKPAIESDLGLLAQRAAHLQREGELAAVVSAGGDGTAAAVVNRIAPEIPLAIFPLGTENLLGRWLGQEATPQAVCDTIVGGQVLRLDAAQANGRLFLLMLGVGFDAAVVQRAHEMRRGHINRWHYFWPIHRALWGYRFPELRVTYSLADSPGEMATTQARWAFAFNLPCYARGLSIAPQADGSDGALDLITFAHGSIWHGLRYLSSVILRRHHQLADHGAVRVTRLRIEADDPVPFQLDGDPGGVLPVEVEVLLQRLTLLAPRGFRSPSS
jgi:diacylglycerol kinase (ATP)